jgi:hypothetical protein
LPPSPVSTWPVANEALSDATKATARAISSGRPIGPSDEAPSIDLVLGYHEANNSLLLRTFLSRVDDMVGNVARSSKKS